jgi:hypothetical protein
MSQTTECPFDDSQVNVAILNGPSWTVKVGGMCKRAWAEASVTNDGWWASVEILIGWVGFQWEWPVPVVEGGAGANVENRSARRPHHRFREGPDMWWSRRWEGGLGGLPGPRTCRNVLRLGDISRPASEDGSAGNEAGLTGISRSFRGGKCAGGACRSDRGGYRAGLGGGFDRAQHL